jgi:hypothetical protein
MTPQLQQAIKLLALTSEAASDPMLSPTMCLRQQRAGARRSTLPMMSGCTSI